MRKNLSLLIGLVSMLSIMPGCSSVITKPGSLEQLKEASRNDSATPYHLGVGDEVEIKFFFAPELNDRVEIRPDGKISMMFAQDIQAEGLTPDQLSTAIRERLTRHIRQSDLVVTVRNFASQKVFIGGEVTRPGPVLLTGHENVIQALAEAGWMTPSAKTDEVVLVRRGVDGKEIAYPISISKIVSGQDVSQNVIVEAGDVLLVPPSNAVAVDRWVEQNIRLALPFNMSAGYIYTNQGNAGSVFR